jgi:hypothetical protein
MVRNGRDLLEIIAAVLLGLVSVMTTFGAYQAASWSGKAAELASVSQQLRDRNLTEFITSQLTSKDDGSKLFEMIALDSELILHPEREGEVRREQEVIIQSASPQLAVAWDAWVDCDFCENLVPLSAPDYETALFASPVSMQIAGYVADQASDEVAARSAGITVGAVVFAIALFMLGVAAATGSVRTVAVLVAGGALAFVVGTTLILFAVF